MIPDERIDDYMITDDQIVTLQQLISTNLVYLHDYTIKDIEELTEDEGKFIINDMLEVIRVDLGFSYFNI